MKYIVYLTVNTKAKVNNINKIYVGVHKTENPEIFDGYLGCGAYAHRPNSYKCKYPMHLAIKKYGPKAFIRYTLYIFDTAEEAYKKEAEIVDINFIKQPYTYNISLGGTMGGYYSPLYQFDLKGNLVKKWEYSKEAYDYYNLDSDGFDSAKRNKCIFLNSYWSTSETIDINEYSKAPLNKKTYLYDLNGNLINSYTSLADCAKDINYDNGELSRAIRNQSCIKKTYYVSYKLLDKFIPKARIQYKQTLFYVYNINKGYIGKYKGKEIMPIIDLHSWGDIGNIFRHDKGWYKDYYISLEYLENCPIKSVNKGFCIEVYDKQGSFIELLYSLKDVRIKYNIPYIKLKNIQYEDKYYGDYIFKYKNSK